MDDDPRISPVQNPSRPRRMLWVVNHKALIAAELPILRSLGYEIFVPKIIPGPGPFRSGAVTWDYDATLTIPIDALDILNGHEFYERNWTPTLRRIINSHFDVAVVSLSAFAAPFESAIKHFAGKVLARTFGLEHPRTYSDILDYVGKSRILDDIPRLGERYAFVQGYSNLAEIEPAALGRNAVTVTLPLAPMCYDYENTWTGKGGHAVMLCPSITDGYYQRIYNGLKENFGDLPHLIFGRQIAPVADAAVLPYMSDEGLFKLYAEAPVFIYPHTEPRHIHYSPIEAMVVGTPVLYLKGSLSDTLASHAPLPGRCDDVKQMHAKAKRLLSGDHGLATDIQNGQHVIIAQFAAELARRQWASVLGVTPSCAR
ncbi:hypothetical protein J8J14_19470 [Roseomonas sp. SSH11]|uniref:Uncharacterized protein n=1 Tax=Pararoseomonas baculiformis TaxID=2820812 RepID=A0ABS4AIX7_9PROT|nr:hypothetical protein [Pararoseomonas baculiformis]MBP0446960.1 hypothetical protein [Pararoseomonas baculiformis]